jgi:uncharacterized protein (DUF3084 family)
MTCSLAKEGFNAVPQEKYTKVVHLVGQFGVQNAANQERIEALQEQVSLKDQRIEKLQEVNTIVTDRVRILEEKNGYIEEVNGYIEELNVLYFQQVALLKVQIEDLKERNAKKRKRGGTPEEPEA